MRKLIGELGAAIAASGSGEATVAPVTAAASTGSQHTAPTGQAQHAPGEAAPCNQAVTAETIFATHPAA